MFVICTCIEYDMISCTQANCTENQSQSVILSTQFVAKILHFASCKVQSVNCENCLQDNFIATSHNWGGLLKGKTQSSNTNHLLVCMTELDTNYVARWMPERVELILLDYQLFTKTTICTAIGYGENKSKRKSKKKVQIGSPIKLIFKQVL